MSPHVPVCLYWHWERHISRCRIFITRTQAHSGRHPAAHLNQWKREKVQLPKALTHNAPDLGRPPAPPIGWDTLLKPEQGTGSRPSHSVNLWLVATMDPDYLPDSRAVPSHRFIPSLSQSPVAAFLPCATSLLLHLVQILVSTLGLTPVSDSGSGSRALTSTTRHDCLCLYSLFT